jgi:methionine sulfoxide reductase heme-binding subunit
MMLKRRLSKVAVFLICLMPFAWLGIAAFTNGLSANPIKDITEATGTCALRFLLVTLCITPFRKLTGWNEAIKYRRMLGLFAFFYGSVHFLTYAWLDQLFSIPDILQDVYKRPFITAGFTGFVVMIPLAITSTKKWIVRLGGKQWQLLHRLTYVSAIAGVAHYLWLVKADIQRPLIYGFLLSILLGYRVLQSLRAVRRAHPRAFLKPRRLTFCTAYQQEPGARSCFMALSLLADESETQVRGYMELGYLYVFSVCERSDEMAGIVWQFRKSRAPSS